MGVSLIHLMNTYKDRL